MNATEHHKRFPNARPATLAYLRAREATTAQLQRENEQKRMREILAAQRDRSPRQWWQRPLAWWERLFS